MKILMVTPYVPYPPSSGGQIRTFNLLKHLSTKNNITLVALYKNASEKAHYDYLKKYCKQIYLCQRPEKPWQINLITRAVFSRSPFLIIRNFSTEAKEVISQLLKKERYDVIHAETFYVMPHIPETKIPIILVEQTIEYRVYQHFVKSLLFIFKPLFYLDIIKLKYWERYFWKKANLVAAMSTSDQKIIKDLEPELKTVIVPNGAGEEMIIKKINSRNIKKPIFLFQGNFNWIQNVEAVRIINDQIIPKIIPLFPNFEFIISGQNTNKLNNVITHSHLQLIEIKDKNISTVKKLYQIATLFIAPIFGPGGTRLKILAAMASGLPVISTRTGIEGLKVTDHHDVIISNQINDFAEKIKNVLSDTRLYKKIQKNAYNTVLKNYNWIVIAKKLDNIYNKLKKE